MADFNFYINRQGIQGRKGDKGDTGFSPTISVGTDTLDEYKLIIANESNSFETPNLRGNINIQDNGGTYLRYDTETKQISAQSIDAATADTLGGVRLSTEADIVEMGAKSVVTPSDVADALPLYLEGEGAVTITQDELTSKTKIKVDVPSVNDLESRMSTAETEIADIQTDVTNLNNNKVAKTDLATTESAGIVKVDGTSITVAGDGTISASPSGTLPIASTTQLGGVKVDGTSIVADENGVISSVGGGATIDDNNISTTTVYSSDKTVNLATNLVDNAMITLNQTKQDTLVSGTNIKTINGQSILGEGDITISGGGGTGDVPIATTTTAGKVKPDGTTITVTEDGTISANSSYTLPTASTTQLGGVKVDGTSVTINSDGVISAAGGGSTPTNMVTTDTNQTINGSKIFANGTGTIFTGTSSNSNSLTIDADDKEIRFNSKSRSPAVIKNQGWTDVDLNIGENFNSVKITTTLYDKNGNEITGGGGGAPENMVTTDTDQIITGAKTFTNSITFNNTLNMSTANTDTLYIHSSGSYASGYTTDIDFHKNLNINGNLSGGIITLAPYSSGLSALKYKDSSRTSNPSYDILHTGNLVTGNNIAISEPNSTGVRTISGPSNEYIASMAMPSTNYVNLTLGASGATYTAPADGYVAVSAKSSQANSNVQIVANFSSNLMHSFNSISAGAWARFYIPMRKGQTFSYEYNGSFASNSIVFVYAVGSAPAA